jgi:peroxiredoxin/mono/diheme cytochrome c family protein
MAKRLTVPLIAVAVLGILSGSLVGLNGAEKGPANLGRKVADFSLRNTQGQTVSLTDFNDKKAVVVVFTGTECVVNNAFMPRLAELSSHYSPRGVQFLAVNSNRQDTPARLAEHVKQYAIPFPVLKDTGNAVADEFGAQRTPEAFVIDGARTIRYRGRIDDQFGIGFRRAQPTQRDLALALDELLSGKPISKPATEVSGCLIARTIQPRPDGSVTYARHVSRILQKNCQECHRPGQVAPMSLLTYDDAVAWGETIREVIRDNRMPPWYADPRYGHFFNDRRLPSDERQALLAWLDSGMPKGDEKDLPSPREFAEGWTIGKPDVILTMPEEFTVPAQAPSGGVPYQYFHLKTDFKEDLWISRAEARAGAPSVVHHIILFIVPPGEKWDDGENPNVQLLVGTAPGEMPTLLKPGYAKRIPAGSELVFQMHYTANGTETKDRSQVGIILAKGKPKYNVHTLPVSNDQFEIPAGADNHLVESWMPVQESGQLLGFMPHMHLRGKDFLYEIVHPDGRKETLLSVPRYNFAWQSYYRLVEPLRLEKGMKLHCVAHFDNSAGNPNNPDSTEPVIWGDQTWEEMMIGWIDYVNEKGD